MYIPRINLETDREKIVAFMKKFSFATIITAKGNLPIATHLPFLVTIRDDNVILTSHFAKANEHWTDIENNKVLVIFNEPHAYISPKNYEKTLQTASSPKPSCMRKPASQETSVFHGARAGNIYTCQTQPFTPPKKITV